MRTITKLLAVFVGVAAVLAPTLVWAQDVVPQPELRRAPPVWVGYLVMFVLAAAVMLVSLLPSKRGHQD